MHDQTLDFSNMCLTFKEYSMPPGVNFINLFTHSFYARRSQKRKKAAWVDCFFAILGSACVKAARKMLVKLTYDYFNGIMVFRNAVLRDTFRDDLFYLNIWNEIFSYLAFFPLRKVVNLALSLTFWTFGRRRGRMLLPRCEWNEKEEIQSFCLTHPIIGFQGQKNCSWLCIFQNSLFKTLLHISNFWGKFT